MCKHRCRVGVFLPRALLTPASTSVWPSRCATAVSGARLSCTAAVSAASPTTATAPARLHAGRSTSRSVQPSGRAARLPTSPSGKNEGHHPHPPPIQSLQLSDEELTSSNGLEKQKQKMSLSQCGFSVIDTKKHWIRKLCKDLFTEKQQFLRNCTDISNPETLQNPHSLLLLLKMF